MVDIGADISTAKKTLNDLREQLEQISKSGSNKLTRQLTAQIADLQEQIEKLEETDYDGPIDEATIKKTKTAATQLVAQMSGISKKIGEMSKLTGKDAVKLLPDDTQQKVKAAEQAITRLQSAMKAFDPSALQEMRDSYAALQTEARTLKREMQLDPSIKKEYDEMQAALDEVNQEIRRLTAEGKEVPDTLRASAAEWEAWLGQSKVAQLDRAEKGMKALQNSIKEVGSTQGDATSEMQKLAETLKGLGASDEQLAALGTAAPVDRFQRLVDLFNELIGKQLNGVTGQVGELQQKATGASEAIGKIEQKTEAATEAAKEFKSFNNEMEQMGNNILRVFSLQNGFQLLKKAINAAFNSVKELDAAMTETAVVTDFSISDMWNKMPTYTEMANKLGVSIKGAYETTTLLYQQGLKTNEVMSAGENIMKMAKIANLDYAEATDMMTAAIRGFNMEMNDTNTQIVNDTYSKLAAITASSTEEIATAMTKTAAIANSAGMEFQTTSAFLSQIIETTRESAETAGTALKTVIARFQELKKDPSEIGEVDGEIVDANKIETALRSVGVALRDSTGQFRDLDDVFIELSSKWDGLDKNTQRYIATIAAGSRQQSRFVAMMQNYSRTMELVDAANNSAGTSNEQFDKTLDSMESKLERLTNAWTTFTTGILNSEAIKWLVDALTSVLTLFNDITSSTSGFANSINKLASAIQIFSILKILVGKFLKDIMMDVVKNFRQAGEKGGNSFQQGFKSAVHTKGLLKDTINTKETLKQLQDARQELQTWKDGLVNMTQAAGEKAGQSIKNLKIQAGALAEFFKDKNPEIAESCKVLANSSSEDYDAIKEKMLGFMQQGDAALAAHQEQLQNYQQEVGQNLKTAISVGMTAVAGIVSALGKDSPVAQAVAQSIQTISSLGFTISSLVPLVKVTGKQIEGEAVKTATEIETKVTAALGWIGIVLAAISAVVSIITSIVSAIKESRKQAAEAQADTAKTELEKLKKEKEEIDAVTELYKHYQELREQYEKTGENSLELVNTTAALLDKYDEEYDMLKLLSGQYEEYTETILKAQRAKYGEAIEKNEKIVKKQLIQASYESFEENEGGLDLNLAQGEYALNVGSYGRALTKNLKEGEDYRWINGQLVLINKNGKQAMKIFNEISEIANSPVFEGFSKEAQGAVAKYLGSDAMNDVLETYQNSIDQATEQLLTNIDETINTTGTNVTNRQFRKLYNDTKDTLIQTYRDLGMSIEEATKEAEKVLREKLLNTEYADEFQTNAITEQIAERVGNSTDATLDRISSTVDTFVKKYGADSLGNLMDQMYYGISVEDAINTVKLYEDQAIRNFARKANDALRDLTIIGNKKEIDVESDEGKNLIDIVSKYGLQNPEILKRFGYTVSADLGQILKHAIETGANTIANSIINEVDKGTKENLKYKVTPIEYVHQAYATRNTNLKKANTYFQDRSSIAENKNFGQDVDYDTLMQGRLDYEIGRKSDARDKYVALPPDSLEKEYIDRAFRKYENVYLSSVQVLKQHERAEKIESKTFKGFKKEFAGYQGVFDPKDAKTWFLRVRLITKMQNAYTYQGSTYDKAHTSFAPLSEITRDDWQGPTRQYLQNIINNLSTFTDEQKAALRTAGLIDDSGKPIVLQNKNDSEIYDIYTDVNKYLGEVDTYFQDLYDSSKNWVQEGVNKIKEDQITNGKNLDAAIKNATTFTTALLSFSDNMLMSVEDFENMGLDQVIEGPVTYVNGQVKVDDTVKEAMQSKVIKEGTLKRDENGKIIVPEEFTSDMLSGELEQVYDAAKFQMDSLEEMATIQGYWTDEMVEAYNTAQDAANDAIAAGAQLTSQIVYDDEKTRLEDNKKEAEELLSTLEQITQAYDYIYNELKKINAEQRKRNELEWEYKNILTKNGLTAEEYRQNLTDRLATYQNEVGLRNDTLDKSRGRINELIETYGQDYGDYVTYDEKTNTVQVNTNDLYAADLDPDYVKELKEYADKLQTAADNIDSSKDSLMSLYDSIESLKQEIRNTTSNFMERVKSAIVADRQKEIDALKAINDSVNQTNEDILSGIQEVIDEERTQKQREKEMDELDDKQRRLAILSQDTSGANAVEIAQLQKEIEEGQDQLLENLIDDNLNYMQKQNEEAYNQRQKQIDLMQESLDAYSKSPEIWNEVKDIITAASGEGVVLEDTQLYSLLSNADNAESLNEIKKMEWLTTLQNDMTTASEYLGNGGENSPLFQDLNAQQEVITQKLEDVKKDILGTNAESGMKGIENKIKDTKDNIHDYSEQLKNLDDKVGIIAEKFTNTHQAATHTRTHAGVQHQSSPNAPVGYVDGGENTYGYALGDPQQGTTTGTTHGGVSTWGADTDQVTNSWIPSINDSIYDLQGNQLAHLIAQLQYDPDTKNFVRPSNLSIQALKYFLNLSGPDNEGYYKDSWLKENGEIPLGWSEEGADKALRRMAMNWGFGDKADPNNLDKVDVVKFLKYLTETKFREGYTPARVLSNNKPGPMFKYATGGLNEYTGPAWLDGTPSKPELVLNATDTANLLRAVDLLRDMQLNSVNAKQNVTQTFNIEIQVDSIADDYDVDRLVDRIQAELADKATKNRVNFFTGSF